MSYYNPLSTNEETEVQELQPGERIPELEWEAKPS